jgi:uncharacterized protein with GYD domain
MSLYMTQFAYTSDAWATMIKCPSDRGEVLRAFIEKQGGRLIGIYYCFGEYDGVAIYEYPDNLSAMVGAIAPTAQGFLRSTKTTVLFSMDDGVEAMSRAKEAVYPAPEG